jgi:hypothetical protein
MWGMFHKILFVRHNTVRAMNNVMKCHLHYYDFKHSKNVNTFKRIHFWPKLLESYTTGGINDGVCICTLGLSYLKIHLREALDSRDTGSFDKDWSLQSGCQIVQWLFSLWWTLLIILATTSPHNYGHANPCANVTIWWPPSWGRVTLKQMYLLIIQHKFMRPQTIENASWMFLNLVILTPHYVWRPWINLIWDKLEVKWAILL